MAETPGTGGRFESMSLEQRLDALGEQGGSGVAAGAVAGLGATAVAARGPADDVFRRAVAGRRAALIAKAAGGGFGVVGIAAVLVLFAMRVPQPPAPPRPVRGEEPTFWNLRAGVDDPATLDQVRGLNLSAGGTGTGSAVGVGPGSWPGDLLP